MTAARPARRQEAGFTLLEVLVAMVILGLAVTTMLQLTSQALRLLYRSGEHQRAVLLADRLLRQAQPDDEHTETGSDEPFTWERRTARVPVPQELVPPAGAATELFVVSVAVRWGTRSVELSSMRAMLLQNAAPGTP